jgi:hypothetical protein
MPMNASYLNAIRDHGQSLITHIGLVDDLGAAVATREAVTWTDPEDGLSRPSADIVFAVTAGTTVAGWRGYSAVSAGTEYGGADFTAVSFSNDGTFTLLAASTSIDHNAA